MLIIQGAWFDVYDKTNQYYSFTKDKEIIFMRKMIRKQFLSAVMLSLSTIVNMLMI